MEKKVKLSYFVCLCALQAKVTLKNPSVRRRIDEAFSSVKKSKS